MEVNFKRDQSLCQELVEWHKSLQKNKGMHAHFRRAKSVDEIIFIPSFHTTCQKFHRWFDSEKEQKCLAAILGLISHVKEHQGGQSLAASMAMDAGERPLVSELRFKRLLQLDRNSLYTPMVRILKHLNSKTNINICDLAESIYYWGDDQKRKWAFAYFPKIKDRKENF